MATPSSGRILAHTPPPRPRDIVSAMADDTGKIEVRLLESLLDAPPLDDTLVGSSGRMRLLVAQSAKSDPPTGERTSEPPTDPYGKGSIPTPRISSAAELQAWLGKAPPPPYSSSDASSLEAASRETLPEIPVALPASSLARRAWPSLVVGALLVASSLAYAWLRLGVRF